MNWIDGFFRQSPRSVDNLPSTEAPSDQHREIRNVSRYEQLWRARRADRLVIFVHGFGGHYKKTWGGLPDFLAADPQFSQTDIYLFGFESGLLRYFVAPLDALGHRLRTVLIAQAARRYRSIAIVAHSMGGLVVKEAVASALLSGDAHKIRALRQVLFCSTPHLGEVKATALAILGAHLGQLSALRNEIVYTHGVWQNRIRYSPPQDDDIVHERYTARIRVTNLWGLSDWVVSRDNAAVLVSDQQVVTLPGTHRSMVKPSSSHDDVYSTIASLLIRRDTHRSGILPSERVLSTSRQLRDSSLHIASTQAIPEKYESLCGKLTQ